MKPFSHCTQPQQKLCQGADKPKSGWFLILAAQKKSLVKKMLMPHIVKSELRKSDVEH